MPGCVWPPEGRRSVHHRLRGTRPGRMRLFVPRCWEHFLDHGRRQANVGWSATLRVVPRTGHDYRLYCSAVGADFQHVTCAKTRIYFHALQNGNPNFHSAAITVQAEATASFLLPKFHLQDAWGGRRYPIPAGKMGFQYWPSFVRWNVRCPLCRLHLHRLTPSATVRGA